MKDRIQAVIFDMYETLITHYDCPLYFSEQMGEDAGIKPELFRALWRPTENERSIGKLTVDEVVADILRQCECYSDELLKKIMDKRIATKEECFRHLHPEILGMLEMLKERKIKIGLISNCFSEEAAVIRESVLSPYFDAVILSYEQGVAKPDPLIYARCLAELGVKSEECLYVGDGGSNELQGAKEAGMKPLQAVWYLTEKNSHLYRRNEAFIQLEHPMELQAYL